MRRFTLAGLFCCLLSVLSAQAQPQVLTNDTMVTTWSDSLARGIYGQRQNFFIGSYFINNYPQFFVSYRDHSRSGDNNLGMATNRVPVYGIPDWYSLGTKTNGLNFYYVSDNDGFHSNGIGLDNITATFNILAKAPTNTYTRLGFPTNDFPNDGRLFHSIFIGEIAEQRADGIPEVRDSSYGARNVADSNGIPFVDSWMNMVSVVTNAFATNATAFWAAGHPLDELQFIWAFTTLTYPTNNHAGLGVDTNIYTAIINFNAATVSLTNHCTATSLSKSGNALTFTFHADRMAPGFYVPDGVQTNDCRGGIRLMPALGNAMYEVWRFTNLPAGNYQLTLDGSNILVTTSTQLAAGLNGFTNYNGSFWAQKKQVLGLMLDTADFSRTNASDDVTIGNVFNTDYESFARVVWATNFADVTLYATATPMAARESDLKVQDIAIHNAAQQTNHTVTLTLIDPVVINTNATLLAQSSQSYAAAHSDSPDDGSVQSQNPPVFKWIYTENPRTMFSDIALRTFVFQLTTNGSFASPYWSIATSNNMYNTLPPITNASGGVWTGTNLWRVIYYASNATTILATGAVHNFTMPVTASNWDRSMLADSNYLYSALAQHPHMWFSVTNRTAVSTSVRAGQHWQTITNWANSAITQSWWNNPSTFTNLSPAAARNTMFPYIWSVALVYQLTTNSVWTNANPGAMLDLYAQRWTSDGDDQFGSYTDGYGVSKDFAISADWLWELMNATQRSNVVFSMSQTVRFFVNGGWWFQTIPVDTNRVYAYTKNTVGLTYAAKTGNSHARFDMGTGLTMCLALWNENTNFQALFPYFINPSIAEKDYARADEGRHYNDSSFNSENWGGFLVATPLLRAAQLERCPDYNQYLNFYAYSEPVFYAGTWEPWGSLGYQVGLNYPVTQLIFDTTLVRDIAQMTGNGAALRQANRQRPTGLLQQNRDFDVFMEYYFSTNNVTEADWSSTAYIDPLWGYCIMGDHQPNAFAAFTNGIGIMTQARPGPRMEHATPTDGSLQMWAFGAQVTQGGAGNYVKHPMYSSGMVFVDGIGVAPTAIQNPSASVYSRFTAFTNSADFSFAASETRSAYNITNLIQAQFPIDYWPFYSYATNTRPYLTTMAQNILFPHKRYAVLYDTMTSSKPAQFEWLWHYAEPTGVVNTNGCSFTYTATNLYNGSNVTVYVVPFVNPAMMTLTNLAGTNNAFFNPFTGENYTNGDAVSQGSAEPRQNGNIWVYNKSGSTNWHFGWVVYPRRGDEPAPTITAMGDDLTVQVVGHTNDNSTYPGNWGQFTDTITLDPNLAASTFQVALANSGTNSGGGGSVGSTGNVNIMHATTVRVGQ